MDQLPHGVHHLPTAHPLIDSDTRITTVSYRVVLDLRGTDDDPIEPVLTVFTPISTTTKFEPFMGRY